MADKKPPKKSPKKPIGGARAAQLDFGRWDIYRLLPSGAIDTSIGIPKTGGKDGFVGVVVVEKVERAFLTSSSPKFDKGTTEHWIYAPGNDDGGLQHPSENYSYKFVFGGTNNWATTKAAVTSIRDNDDNPVQLRQVVALCSAINSDIEWNQ